MFEISSWNIQQSALWVVFKIKNTLMSLLLDDLMEQKFTFAKFNELILSSIWFIFSESMSTWIKCWFVIFSILKVPYTYYDANCRTHCNIQPKSCMSVINDQMENYKSFQKEKTCARFSSIQCNLKWKSIR